MKKLISILVFITLFGCTQYIPPKEYYILKEFTFDKSYEATWNKIIEYFANRGIPIKNMDKSSGFISTEYSLNLDYGCMECGSQSGNILDNYSTDDRRGYFNILIKNIADNKTKVNINCFFRATMNIRDMYGKLIRSQNADCNSTGELEKEIFDFIGQ